MSEISISEPSKDSAAFVRIDWEKVSEGIRVGNDTILKVQADCREKMFGEDRGGFMTISPSWLASVMHELVEYRKSTGKM